MAMHGGGTEVEEEVLANYKLELDELTSNDIDDIKRLTIIAKDKDEMPVPARFAQSVVDTICKHILEAPKEHKMPPLYLLDSIAKNVGGVYVEFISARLVEVFIKAYHQADPSMHSVMERLFRTWLNQKIFHSDLLLSIQSQVEFPSMTTDSPLEQAGNPGSNLPPSLRSTGGIHVNPMFLHQGGPGRGRGFMGLPAQDLLSWRQTGGPDLIEGQPPRGSLSGRGFPRVPLGRGDARGFPPGMPTGSNGVFLGGREHIGNGDESFGPGRGSQRIWGVEHEDNIRSGEDFEMREGAFAPGGRMRNGFGHTREEIPGRPGQAMGWGGPHPGGEGFWGRSGNEEMPDYTFEAELSRKIEGGRMGQRNLHGVGIPRDLLRERATSPVGRIIDAGPVAIGDDKPEVPDWIKQMKNKPVVPDWLKEKTAKVKATLAREAWEERTAGIEEEWSDGEDFGQRAPPSGLRRGAPPPSVGPHQGSPFFMSGPRAQPPPPPPPPPGLPPHTNGPSTSVENTAGSAVVSQSTASLFPPQQLPQQPAPPIPQGPPPARARPVVLPPQATTSQPHVPDLLLDRLPSQQTGMESPRRQIPPQAVTIAIETAPPEAAGVPLLATASQNPSASSVPASSVPEASSGDLKQGAPQGSQQVPQNLLQQLLQQATQLVASTSAAQQGAPNSSAPPAAASALAALLQLIPTPAPPSQPSATPQTVTPTQAGAPAQTPTPQNLVVPSAMIPTGVQAPSQPVVDAPAPVRPTLVQPPLPLGPPPAQARVPSPLTVPRPAAMPSTPVLPVASGPAPLPTQNLLSAPASAIPPSSSAPAQPPLPPGAPPLATILASVVPAPTPAPPSPPSAPPRVPSPAPASNGTATPAPLTNILTQDLLSSLVSYGLISAPVPSISAKTATAPPVQTGTTAIPSSIPATASPVQIPAIPSIPASISPPPQPLLQLSAPLPAQPVSAPAGPPPQPIATGPSGSMNRPANMIPIQGHMPGMPVMNGMGMHPMGMAPMGGMHMPGMYPMQSIPYQSNHNHMPMLGQPMQHYVPHHRMQPGMRPMPGYGVHPLRGQPAPPPGHPGMPVMGSSSQRPLTPTGRETNEVGTEFKMDELRVRHDSVIRALYTDFSHHCKTCSRRFHTQAEYAQHLDWHFKQNQKRKAQKTTSRCWFVSVDEWLSGTGAKSTEAAPSFFAELATSKPKEEEDSTAVFADELQKACILCGEEFEVFFSPDADEWMYKGAVYLNATGKGMPVENSSIGSFGPIVHAKCRSLDIGTGGHDGTGALEEQRANDRGGDSSQRGLSEQGHAGNGSRKKEPREEEELSDSRRKRARF